MTAPLGPIHRRLGPFRHRPFVAYWTGGVLSNVGTWLQAVAASVFIYQLTGSAFMVGVLNFAAFLPILLFSVPGGILSDRVDRRVLVTVTHVIAGGLAALLAVLAFVDAASELHVIAIAFAINTSYAFGKPALASLVPTLVPREDLADAVGLNTLQFMGGQLIGPVIAAVALATSGPGWAFAINAATFLGPIFSMMYLSRHKIGGRVIAPPSKAGATPAPQPSGGLAYLRAEAWVILLLVGVFSTSSALEIMRTLAPAYVVENLSSPESAAGFIIAAQSAGSAIGLFAFVWLRRRLRLARIAVIGLLLQAFGLVAAAFAAAMPAALFAMAIIGLGFAFAFTAFTGTLQGEVPDEMRGRVMSYHTLSHLGNRPFTALAAGGLATTLGPQAVLLGAIVLAPVGMVAAQRAWRKLDSRIAVDESEAANALAG